MGGWHDTHYLLEIGGLGLGDAAAWMVVTELIQEVSCACLDLQNVTLMF